MRAPIVKHLPLAALIFGVATFTSLFVASPVGAAYTDSRLIDDPVFVDSKSMSLSQIQSFLESKNSYLSNHNFFSEKRDASVRAAQIIYDAAQDYGLNPRVILATLQKEQSLVTDPTPSSSQINYAMGYGCPTSGGCSFPGFYNQVANGTWQLRFNYERARGNNEWWDPSKSYACGGATQYYSTGLYPGRKVSFKDGAGKVYKTFTIQNAATAAMYCYTPHVYPGSSEYYYSGSYNFVVSYEQWFGSTFGTPFFRIDNGAKVYVLSASGDYYYVPSESLLRSFGYKTAYSYIGNFPSSYTTGRTELGALSYLARFEDDSIYAVQGGYYHKFPSRELYESYGFSIGVEATLPYWMQNSLRPASDMASVLKLSDGVNVYSIAGGKKRLITSQEAFSSLGTPAYSAQASVKLDSGFASKIADGAPILMPGYVVKSQDSGAYKVWDGTNLYGFAGSIGTYLKPSVQYIGPDSSINQLTTSSSTIPAFVKNSNGDYFLLDLSNSKMPLTSSQISSLSLNTSSFMQVPDRFLSALQTKVFPAIIRVNGGNDVFQVSGNRIIKVLSKEDLLGLGYSTSSPVNVSPNTAGLFTNPGWYALRQGRLVRFGQTSPIYMINNNNRVYIPSKGILLAYGYKTDGVVSIPEGSIDQYTLADENLPQIVVDGSNTYWVVDQATRRKLTSSLALEYPIAGAISLSTPNVLSLREGPRLSQLLKSSGNNAVYLMEDGKKRHISNEAALKRVGGSNPNISIVSSYFIESLPTGATIY